MQKNIKSQNSEDITINASKFKYIMMLYELHQFIRHLCASHQNQITTNKGYVFPSTSSSAFCTRTHNIHTYKRGERGK